MKNANENNKVHAAILNYKGSDEGLEHIKKLIDNATIEEINYKDISEDTPLHLAAREGHIEVVSFLIEAGAEINTKNENYITPLHIAAANGHTAIVEALIAANANIEAKNISDWTPLHIAALRGHTAIVEALIAAGANKEANESNGHTPLLFAAQSGQTATVQALIELGSEINAKNKNCNTPLLFAAQKGHSEVVKFLINKGVDIEGKNIEDFTPLLFAAQSGQTEVVKVLIDKGADKEAGACYWIQRTALHQAAYNGHIEVVKILIAEKANIDAKDNIGKTPLHYADDSGHAAIVEILINAGAKECFSGPVVAIVTYLSLVVVGLLAAYFVPQAFLILTGPLLGSLGLIHNLPVLQVTVLSLIVSLGSILVGSLVSRFDGKMDLVGQNHLVSDELNYGTGNKAVTVAVVDTCENPSELEKGKGNDVQASVAPPAHK